MIFYQALSRLEIFKLCCDANWLDPKDDEGNDANDKVRHPNRLDTSTSQNDLKHFERRPNRSKTPLKLCSDADWLIQDKVIIGDGGNVASYKFGATECDFHILRSTAAVQ